jgi:hypothetical protein
MIRFDANQKVGTNLCRGPLSFTTDVSLIPMRVPARDTTKFVVASLITIGIVHLAGNASKQDNVDKARTRFLTSGIIGKLPLIAANFPSKEATVAHDRSRRSRLPACAG